MEVVAPDEHTARLLFATFLGSVVQEIQTWQTIDLNRTSVNAHLTSIGPADIAGTIRGHYKFSLNGALDVLDGDEHGARAALAELETAILDEVGNWPTTELGHLEITAILGGSI